MVKNSTEILERTTQLYFPYIDTFIFSIYTAHVGDLRERTKDQGEEWQRILQDPDRLNMAGIIQCKIIYFILAWISYLPVNFVTLCIY